jgi:hypothetical protein
MKLGDKIFKVNRDDRLSDVDTHDFIVLELRAQIQVNSFQTLSYFSARHFSDDTSRFLKPQPIMGDVQKNGGTLYIRHFEGDIIVTMEKTLKDLSKVLKEKHSMFYTTKEDAKPEIYDIMKQQLAVMERKAETLVKEIECVKGILK